MALRLGSEVDSRKLTGLEVQAMKSYRVIKVGKKGKTTTAGNSSESTNSMEIVHKVKVVKPWKMIKKLWGGWL
jgi:hypothetical protein